MFLDGMLRLEAAVGVEVVVGRRRASVHHPVKTKVIRSKIDSSAGLIFSIYVYNPLRIMIYITTRKTAIAWLDVLNKK